MSKVIIKPEQTKEIKDTLPPPSGPPPYGNMQLGEWQLCPKCAGEGTVPNNEGLSSTTANRICPVCLGQRILAKPIIK